VLGGQYAPVLMTISTDEPRRLTADRQTALVQLMRGFVEAQSGLTEQIAGFMAEKLQPQGVMVVVEARHLCVEMRGVKKPGALTVTSAIRGIFFNRPVREEFLDLLNRRG